MTNFELALSHMAKGTTYSWDLTVLLGLGIPISSALRDNLLHSRTTADEAAYIRYIHTRRLLSGWREV